MAAVAVTRDGSTWRNAGDLEHLAEDAAYLAVRRHALDCTRDGSCWAAGGSGRVARVGR